MAKTFEGIDDELAAWILAQPMFFVATAPLAADGHVNVSPKGLAGTFSVLGPSTVAYLDLTGSGAETIAHVEENGRIVLMWCAFDGPARIVRLHGAGRIVRAADAGAELLGRFADLPGIRSVVVVEVSRVSDSCGYAVPKMALVEDRTQLIAWARAKGPGGIAEYQADRNATSIDGLPAL